jgi:hypothetical protein
VGAQPPFCSVAATSEPPCRCLLFFLFEQLEVPLPMSSSHFALPLGRSKIASTTSAPESWLVVMSMSSLVVRKPLCPSL